MGRTFTLAALVVMLGLVSCKQPEQPAAPAAPVSPVDKPIQIPRVAGTTSDWTKVAHQVLILTPVGVDVSTKAELAVAWTPAVLLLKIHTNDATPFESATNPWENDSVEIFLSSSYGSDDCVQFVCTPGRTPDHPNPDWHVYDKRAPAPPIVAPEMHTQKEGNGYVMTISIPWANLIHVPQQGDVVGLQVYVNDAQSGGQITHRIWFPEEGTSENPLLMQHVQLADQASAPEAAAAWLQTKGISASIHVSASPEDSGKKIEVWLSGKQISSDALYAGGPDGSHAKISLPHDLAGQKDAPLMVTVDGQPVPATLKVPDLNALRIGLIKNQPLGPSLSIFNGTAFPKIDFLNKDLIEAAIGSYSLHCRYFDTGWNEVTAPSKPGRYGALVEFRSEDGLTCTRQVTLFKTARPYFPAKDPFGVTVKFPAAFDLPADLAAREQWNVSNWAGGNMENMARCDTNGAVLLAALHDLATDPARWHGFNISKIEDTWWAELHKRLGENQDYPHLTHLPDGYDKNQKACPLILFLHGSGERGTDLNRLKNQGPLGYINKGHPLPFIVVTPQCPADEWWNPARLVRLLDQVAAVNRVDPKRIYVTGLSMGGYGTFDLAASYPDKFAAIAPLSGGENPAIAERLKKMPTWIFHGSEDDVVPARYSLDIAHAMQKLGAPVKLTVYPGVGHGGWETTYANPELYTWLLEHSK